MKFIFNARYASVSMLYVYALCCTHERKKKKEKLTTAHFSERPFHSQQWIDCMYVCPDERHIPQFQCLNTSCSVPINSMPHNIQFSDSILHTCVASVFPGYVLRNKILVFNLLFWVCVFEFNQIHTNWNQRRWRDKKPIKPIWIKEHQHDHTFSVLRQCALDNVFFSTWT